MHTRAQKDNEPCPDFQTGVVTRMKSCNGSRAENGEDCLQRKECFWTFESEAQGRTVEQLWMDSWKSRNVTARTLRTQAA